MDCKLLSMFDGTTAYTLGKWTLARRGALGWPPLETCFYAHSTPQAAVASLFPRSSKCLSAPRVLLKVCTRCGVQVGPGHQGR